MHIPVTPSLPFPFANLREVTAAHCYYTPEGSTSPTGLTWITHLHAVPPFHTFHWACVACELGRGEVQGRLAWDRLGAGPELKWKCQLLATCGVGGPQQMILGHIYHLPIWAASSSRITIPSFVSPLLWWARESLFQVKRENLQQALLLLLQPCHVGHIMSFLVEIGRAKPCQNQSASGPL